MANGLPVPAPHRPATLISCSPARTICQQRRVCLFTLTVRLSRLPPPPEPSKSFSTFFIDKLGRSLTTAEMYDFLKSCCLDLGAGGKDSQFGWGLPILPPYEDIDLSQWTATTPTSVDPAASDAYDIPAAKTEFKLKLDSAVIEVDGVTHQIDEPITYDPETERLLGPARLIAQLAGLTVSWDDSVKTATFRKK